jgi:cytochrome c oxidase subunit 2
MVAQDELNIGDLRLLEVDNRVVLPVNTHVRILVTACDVLHSWAVPSLGVKVDACVGRLNETSLFMLRQGIFYGQCSEICGVGHGNMPIVVESVTVDDYISWLNTKAE